MAWIEVHQSLPTHKKTRRLARELKLNTRDFAKAVGHMVMFWLWAMDNAPDGDLSDIDVYDIADAAQWTGDPKKFFDAMKTAGFVDEDNRIHDWDLYIGKLIDRREANAQRNREARARKKAERLRAYKKNDASRDAVEGKGEASRDMHEHITSASRDTENASRDGATVPNRTLPNHTIPFSLSNSPSAVEGEREGETERENFMPPTAEMVEAYARSMGFEVNAAQFIALNEQRGWKDSWGRPIRDWQMWLDGYVRSGAGKLLAAQGGKVPTALNYSQRTYQEGELDYIFTDPSQYMEDKQ